ncbi:PIG-L family deacetylase [Actinomadura sp. KC345]|uniref:PIG-L deacetylase family protein n=1 Tax=Actinomadura sp. KC345 TaxID=2530371 RepID=UPI001043DC33|nr:PIG-L deacetylase family protein [Actinomadura sp. KC345]TDC46005.1 PIG-L family deacetylase [Actinomadura sp. KC345]
MVETVINVLDDRGLQRILVVMAHPDDVDFGAAGTVAGWTDRGIEVVYLMVTDGDAGGFDDNVTRKEMAALRREEQRAAAKCVGVTDVRWLGYSDGRVEATLGLRRDIARVIRQVRPDRVLMPSPERDYERIYPSHPDHRAVGSAALDAVYPDARNPYAFPELLADEGLDAWTAREVWFSGGPVANHYVDVTDRFDRKLNALRAHVSQTGHMGDDLPDMVRGWMTANAAAAGLPEGSLAESFHVIDTA